MGKYLLQGYLDDCWSTNPEKIVLVDGQRSLTYQILHSDSNRIANCLVENRVERQDRVLICMSRSSLVIMAIIGVLKADAIYVPVDAKSPIERILRIAKDCQPSAIVYDEPLAEAIEAVKNRLTTIRLFLQLEHKSNSPKVFTMLRVNGQENSHCDFKKPAYLNIDADAAYILYTSGSTGSPKGVIVSHLNVINYIEWAVDYYNICTEDRILCTAPFQFDMSTFDIFTVLKTGATLCIAPDSCLLFPNKLLDMMEKEEVTLWKGVSSLLAYLSTTGCLKPERIPSLRKVLFGGEILPTKHLINWMKTYPTKLFYNVYGPTEATGISACYQVENVPTSIDEAIPIGKACSNTEIFILTDENRLANIGESGELCIRGSGLSIGYWNDEEKTAKAFIRNPFGHSHSDRLYRSGDLARMREDGIIEYLGRKDFQVKFMGYRIEIFEIENAILSLEHIDRAAVLLCNSSMSEIPELTAFIESQKLIDKDLILRALSQVLPNYMLPRQIVQLERIPLTDRGKTDRKGLQNYYQGLMQAQEIGVTSEWTKA
jgi:D-alanine--poly(phosphoribitol) ligase subunit 1